jgi:hypothetical protein
MSNKTKFILFLFALWFGFAEFASAQTSFEGIRIPKTATQAEAEAGTSTAVRSWTPDLVKKAIDAAIVGKAATNQLFFLGTTQVAINRGIGALSLAGVSLDNAGAQFYDTSAPTKTVKIDPSNQAPGNMGTIQAPDGGTAILPAGTLVTAANVINQAITGFTSGAAALVATDSILQAIQKLDGNIATKAAVNADTTGSAGSIKSTATTGKITISGPAAGQTRAWTVPDADVTIPAGTLAVVSGAFGTPSFTALNAPTSDADPGTTAGQIKHDSTDTASNSGGTFKWYDGAQVRNFIDTGNNYTIITKTEFLPIRYAEDGTTAPATAAQIGTTHVIGRSFTEGDDVVFTWIVPNDYVGGVKYRVIYALSANAQANETVIFSMTGCTVAHSAALACAGGTALTVTHELTTDEDTSEAMITAYSAESNADWNVAAGSITRLAFSNAAAGDYTGEPLVIGIEIKYKAKIIGFDGY